MGVSDGFCKAERMVAVLLLLLVPDGQPIAVKVEDLDSIPATIEEKEEMAGRSKGPARSTPEPAR
jgi:hypothetical protein